MQPDRATHQRIKSTCGRIFVAGLGSKAAKRRKSRALSLDERERASNASPPVIE
jgi:hypothetical protein